MQYVFNISTISHKVQVVANLWFDDVLAQASMGMERSGDQYHCGAEGHKSRSTYSLLLCAVVHFYTSFNFIYALYLTIQFNNFPVFEIQY
jgi:hypothetical protein